MDNCMWVGAGYPIFIAAIVALWAAYRGEHANTRAAELLLIEEKDRHIRELEAFKKMVEDRQKGSTGTVAGRKP